MTREEAIKNLEYLISDDCTDHANDFVEEIEMAIEALKEPERKHGRWIEYEGSAYNGIDEFGDVKWIPKKFFRCETCSRGTVIRSRFCYNCGAIMDKE